MIAKGFEMTKLALDFDSTQTISDNDLDEHYTLKSRQLIADWADVPIFVFFKKADNSGVAVEIAYTCLNKAAKQSSYAFFLR